MGPWRQTETPYFNGPAHPAGFIKRRARVHFPVESVPYSLHSWASWLSVCSTAVHPVHVVAARPAEGGRLQGSRADETSADVRMLAQQPFSPPVLGNIGRCGASTSAHMSLRKRTKAEVHLYAATAGLLLSRLAWQPPARVAGVQGCALLAAQVCEAFIFKLRERRTIDLDAPGVIEGIQQHFQLLPTRYGALCCWRVERCGHQRVWS